MLDIDEEDVDLEILEDKITEIPEIIKIEEVPNMGIGLCLILVLLVPLITEIIIRRSPKAIKKLKKVISNATERSRRLYPI